MAKLKPLLLEEKSESGEEMRFAAPVTVGVSGIFRAVCPRELEPSLEGLRKAKAISAGFEVDVRENLVVFGSRLDEVEATIRAAMKDHLKCEVKVERIIAYSFASQVSYYHGLDGEIHPNGAYDTKAVGNGSVGARWGGHIGQYDSVDHYSIGIFAQVLDKTSYIRPSGTKVKYENAAADDDASFHGKLDALLKLTPAENRDGKFSEMPFSEDAAKFFYESMIGLCKIAHRMEAFFSNPAKVAAAIESRAGSVLSLTDT